MRKGKTISTYRLHTKIHYSRCQSVCANQNAVKNDLLRNAFI